MPRTHPKGLIFSASKKENPINFSSMGIGARGTAIRNRISRAVFVPNRGVNFTDGNITVGMKSIISSLERINVAESGTSNTFTVKLDRQPLNKSALIIESGDTTEVKVHPKRVEFDRNNWNTPVTITVTGVDDTIDDANVDTYVKVSVLYGEDVKLIPVRNYDDEDSIQQIVFANLTNTTINKTEGSSASISVYLTKAPSGNTTISVTSDNTSAINSIATAVTFTPSDYNTPKTITLPIIDDEIDNTSARNVGLTFTESDTSRSSIITVNVDDNDVIGINHTTVPNFIYEGDSFIIDLSLSKIPEGNVGVITSTSDPSKFTVANASRTFTPANYNTTQNVQITANNGQFSTPEEVFDISFTFTAASGGGQYISTKTEQLIVYDSNKVYNTSIDSITVNEGDSFTFDVSLSTRPQAGNVVVEFNENANNRDLISDLTFTQSNWKIAQQVTVQTKVNGSTNNESDNLVLLQNVDDATPFVQKTISVTINHVAVSAPGITNITSANTNGAYNNGIISITIVFDEIVNVVTTDGTPSLALNSGGTATYVSGTGTDTLIFDYVIANGNNTADLDYSNTTALVLNGGTIKDADANDATITLVAPGQANSLGANKSLVVLTSNPVITVTGSNPETITEGTTYSDSGAAAVDALGTSLTVSTTNPVDTSTIGAYTVTYTATDAAGNNQTATRIVNVTASSNTVALTNPSTVNVVNSGGNKYVLNGGTTYNALTDYGLAIATYTLQNVPEAHPIAFLTSGNSNIAYAPVSTTTIIKVSGGGTSANANGDYYTFADENDNAINIANGDFKFMRGHTYEFQANGISSSHPFKVHFSGSDSSAIDGNSANITVSIPTSHSTTAGDLYYQCTVHSGMKANLSLFYKEVSESGETTASYDFYYGSVTVTVAGDFTSVSAYCYYHGYMGGKDLLVYSAS
uniref:HYR domain-containing protein n=1 Tax=viral metagenome TaxID=1070528 RepID=A0A6C0C209_9ZZZZ